MAAFYSEQNHARLNAVQLCFQSLCKVNFDSCSLYRHPSRLNLFSPFTERVQLTGPDLCVMSKIIQHIILNVSCFLLEKNKKKPKKPSTKPLLMETATMTIKPDFSVFTQCLHFGSVFSGAYSTFPSVLQNK